MSHTANSEYVEFQEIVQAIKFAHRVPTPVPVEEAPLPGPGPTPEQDPVPFPLPSAGSQATGLSW